MTARASPDSIIRAAAPIACAPDAHADMTPNTGPRTPWRIASSPAAALPISNGIDSGETRSGPLSRSTSCEFSSVLMPPIPEPITHPTVGRVARRAARLPARVADRLVALAAIASCANRSLRRASFVVMKSVGVELAARAEAVLDARPPGGPALVQQSAPTPSGVTAPTPVIRTRRLIGHPTRRRSRPT